MPVRRALTASFTLAVSVNAAAHAPTTPSPENLWRLWNLDLWLLSAFTLSCATYFRGARRLYSPGRGRACPQFCFWSGMVVLAIAVISPLHALGEALAAAHMLQHMLLFFAAPLLVLSYPLPTFLWSLPRPWRLRLNKAARKTPIAIGWGFISSASFAWTFHAAVLWAWHAPPLYQAALEVHWLHDLEHLSFLLSGLLLWWAIIHRAGTGLLLLFTTMLHGGLLAALMTFSGSLWYPYYLETTAAWGVSPLQDQQLAGMVMWVLGGAGYLLAGLVILGRWLGRVEARMLPDKPYKSES